MWLTHSGDAVIKALSRNNLSIWQPLAGARGSEIPIQSRDREGVLEMLFLDRRLVSDVIPNVHHHPIKGITLGRHVEQPGNPALVDSQDSS